MNLDVDMIRQMDAEFHGFPFCDKKMTFYYDETGNCGKFSLRKDGINDPTALTNDFILGGIAFNGDTCPTDAAKMVADLVVNAVSVVLVAIITFVLLISVKSLWKGIRKLPVLHQVDTVGGVAFGLCQGVLIVSTVMLILSLFSAGGVGGGLVAVIQASFVGEFFYSHNFLGLLIALFIG